MGFFSWKTQDTDESIANIYSSRGAFLVCMHDNRDNIWTEPKYEGYGVFGGKDFYELLAEMNGLKTREEGINLAFSGKTHLSPNLTEGVVWNWIPDAPKSCNLQGYFYDDEEEEEDDYEDDPSMDHLRDEERNFIDEERRRENDPSSECN
jgi:hypothetical protein